MSNALTEDVANPWLGPRGTRETVGDKERGEREAMAWREAREPLCSQETPILQEEFESRSHSPPTCGFASSFNDRREYANSFERARTRKGMRVSEQTRDREREREREKKEGQERKGRGSETEGCCAHHTEV